jgi:DNA repair protein RadC
MPAAADCFQLLVALIGPAAAALARRFQTAARTAAPIESPRDVLAHLARIRRSSTEILAVLLLDRRLRRLGGLVRVAEGGADEVAVQPRALFTPALLRGAAAIVVAHNHPSGSPYPSRADEVFTVHMVRAGRLLGVEVLDHIVVARQSHFSFREAGLLDGDAVADLPVLSKLRTTG